MVKEVKAKTATKLKTGNWFVKSAELPQEISKINSVSSSSKLLVFIEEKNGS